MKYTEEVAAKCASIGAQLLDATDPNWAHHIDTYDLNMASPCNCIVGQLYADSGPNYAGTLLVQFGQIKWSATVSQLITDNQELYELLNDEEDTWPDKFLGFDVPYTEDGIELNAYYRHLKSAWVAEIDRRID